MPKLLTEASEFALGRGKEKENGQVLEESIKC